jgi:hypothetical protein
MLIQDNATATTAYTTIVTDSIATLTTESVQVDYTASVTETNPIVSVEEAVATFVASVTESISISEQQLFSWLASIIETMATSDATTVGTYYQEFIAELAAIADNPQAATGYNVSRSETAVITSTETGRNLWEVIDDTETANWQNISNPQSPGWADVSNTESPGWTDISTR